MVTYDSIIDINLIPLVLKKGDERKTLVKCSIIDSFCIKIIKIIYLRQIFLNI